MKCFRCKRDVNRGTEYSKAIADYIQPDKTIKTYGWDREDGKLREFGGNPTGQLLHIYHYKCFRVAEKREKRGGDAVTGRGMGSIPTAYEITAMTANQDELAMLGLTEEEARGMSTQALSDRVRATRQAAAESGMGADNWAFKEKQRAVDKGGPYEHTHGIKMEDFQLKPHLLYAHGEEAMASENGRRFRHDELHAMMAADATRRSREQDPGYKEPGESDWRDQEVFEVGQLPTTATQMEEAEDLQPVNAPGSSGESLSLDDL